MARRKKHEEHENHERWLVSYADFITLLFAFFVVMYSISSVNEGKYRVLSDSLMAAFRSSARAMDPIQVGQLARSPRSALPAIVEVPKPLDNLRPPIIDIDQYRQSRQAIDEGEDEWLLSGGPGAGQGRGSGEAEGAGAGLGAGQGSGTAGSSPEMDAIAADVETSLRELISDGLVTLRRNRLWLEVEINTSILFNSGSVEPSVDAEIVLKRLATLLSAYSNRIQVEGFTDNQPIVSTVYPSNWELSSARAGAVVRLFAQYGIHPRRLASVGYGEFRPIADNSTEEGRSRNRRVVIVIMANLRPDELDQSAARGLEVLARSLHDTGSAPPPEEPLAE